MILLLVASLAWADAIGVPEECPEGSAPIGNHCGEFCDPVVCDPADPQCDEGQTCEAEVGLCVLTTTTHAYCGDVPDDPVRNPMVERRDAKGPCRTTADCADGQECVVAPRCVRPKATGSLCPFAASVPLGLGLLGLAAAPLGRRSRGQGQNTPSTPKMGRIGRPHP